MHVDIGDEGFGPRVRVRNDISDCSVMGYYINSATKQVNICVCLTKPKMFGKCPDCDITNSKLVEALEMLYTHHVSYMKEKGKHENPEAPA